MQQWDYKVVAFGWRDGEVTFRDLGRDGWELVSVVLSSTGSGSAFFKRPIAPVVGR